MRTIKDPKKKPEVRRRTDYDEEEDDNRSNKSTPPKKRKTAKSPKDDSSSLNDSGSFNDNQSDILSEKSSAYGDDDAASDISSLKSTPPKKRNYSKVANRNAEINGVVSQKNEVQKIDQDEGKVKGPKKGDKKAENDKKIAQEPKVAVGRKSNDEKKSPKGKKKDTKDEINAKTDRNHVKDTMPDGKKSPKGKKGKQAKQDATPVDTPEEKTTPKKQGGRKRKANNDGDEESKEVPVKQLKNVPKETLKEEDKDSKAAEIQSKKPKKSKKQLKDEATLELKRQTEEQRNAHSVPGMKETEVPTTKQKKTPKKKNLQQNAPDTESLDVQKSNTDKTKENMKNEPDRKFDHHLLKSDTQSSASPEVLGSKQMHSELDKIGGRVDVAIKDMINTVTNQQNHANCDDNYDDESSDLDTSFESINSIHNGDEKKDVVTHATQENHSVTFDKLNNSVVGEKVDEKSEPEVSIKCDKCGYISRSKGGHTRHLRKCQPEQLGLESNDGKHMKVHVCEMCDYSAPRRVLVINHMKSHGIYQCKRCNFRTDNEETLDDHSVQEHKDRSDCKFCKLCNRYVKCSEVPLEKHMEECKGRIPFRCPECSKEFQYESSLKCHVVSHYPDQPKLFSCTQCDYKSNYKANLKKHIRHIHEQKGEKTIKCPDCGKMFHTEDNMRRHQKLHSDDRPHKCEHEGCDKAFKTQNGLKFHLTSHQTDRPFACEVDGCGKDFKSKKSLIVHMNETHENAPKNFHCSMDGCEMAFYKKCHFDRHMAAHTDNRNFFCKVITCGKAFRTEESLKTHSLLHTDEKPLKCEHCDYTCRQRNSIRFHMKKKHPELIPNDLTTSTKTAKQASHNSSSTMTTSKVSDIEKTMAINTHDKENLDNFSKLEPSSPLSNPLSNRMKLENDKLQTKDDNRPVSNSSNHDTSPVKHHVSSNDNKQNVPSNETVDNISLAPVLTNTSTPIKTDVEKATKTAENPTKKTKKTDMYEFMSEDESEDEMKPGLLRKEYDKDKPILPPVTGNIDPSLLSDLNLPHNDAAAKKPTEEKTQKVKKKPGPKPKPKPENPEPEVKVPKKRGRKKKSEIEKISKENKDNKDNETATPEKAKPKRGRSPKAKKEMAKRANANNDDDDDDEDEKEVTPVKKKRGPKKKVKSENEPEKVPKKRGRKKKVKEEDKKDIEPENGDATINYSEVESDKMFADSKDGVSDAAEAPLSNIPEHKDKGYDSEKENELCLAGKLDTSENKDDNDDESKVKDMDKVEDNVDTNNMADADVQSDREDNKQDSDADNESSDIGSDFDEDLKPPPAPRPPPMYDSEDGDIESGPENEDNGSFRGNERVRDFESSREISREISRDFESSREIDDSVKTSDANSVETSTPKDTIGTPSSNNPYKNDSVDNQETPYPHSHHSSVPHTPSHNSIPPTPITNQEYESQTRVEETVIKSANIQGQTNDENTDESSMPEVDKDYVGRFFEEIQCNQAEQISRMPNIDDTAKTQDKVEAPQGDTAIAPPNPTEASIQMQSPPTDLSLKRMDILPPERSLEEPFTPRSDSGHRITDRLTNVPTFEPNFNTVDPYANSSIPPRETILRQPDQSKITSPINASNSSASFMRFPDSEAILQRQRMTTPFDRNIQNLHRITDTAIPPHNNASPLLHHVPGREDVFPGAAGVAGSMSRNPFHASWPGQDVRPAHWSHPTYLQRGLDQQPGSTTSSLFGKDSYLPPRDFMFDPSRAAAERNMFSSLASSHGQRPNIAHDTFPLERFDFGSYLSSHAYNAAPSLPVDYTRSAHSSTGKSLDERYRQSSTGVTDFRTLPQSSTASEMFGMNSSFNLEKFYPRESMYHSHNISDNTNNPFLPGVPSQHSMFGRDYTHHRSFYTQNSAYPFMNMNDKNYTAASAKLGHSASAVGQQRELVPVPRPNMAHDPQLQDPYRHSSMLYNMMNRYFE